jgi:hypothetical protein
MKHGAWSIELGAKRRTHGIGRKNRVQKTVGSKERKETEYPISNRELQNKEVNLQNWIFRVGYSIDSHQFSYKVIATT